MAAKFVILDRDTPMMLPPDLRDWISEDSMVHFIVDAVEALEIKGFVRLSPRLDNFYEKIGVKTLGLLYAIVCRLQVPK